LAISAATSLRTGSTASQKLRVVAQRLGLDMIHVPYRGSAPALTALMAGQVQVYMDLVRSAQSHVRAGTVKALGVTTKARLARFADIPTSSGAEGQDPRDECGRSTAPSGLVRRPEAVVRVASDELPLSGRLRRPNVRQRAHGACCRSYNEK
jgi:hypothetical protein